MIELNVSLSIGQGAKRTDTIVLDDSTVEGMTPEAKEAFLEEVAHDWANNYIALDWSIQ